MSDIHTIDTYRMASFATISRRQTIVLRAFYATSGDKRGAVIIAHAYCGSI